MHCPICEGIATWKTDWTNYGWATSGPGYICGECGWAVDETSIRDGADVDFVDDGRIRRPEDVGPRLLGALESARRDRRLSALDRAVHHVCCARASEMRYVEIMAGSQWLADEAGKLLGRRVHRTQAVRSRDRLINLNYLRRLSMSEITSYALRGIIETRKAAGKSPVTFLEVRKAPAWPTCEQCDGRIPDIQRVSKRYCSDRCRKAHGRTDPRVEAKLDEMAAEFREMAVSA